jgi:hypothetical protein
MMDNLEAIVLASDNIPLNELEAFLNYTPFLLREDSRDRVEYIQLVNHL